MLMKTHLTVDYPGTGFLTWSKSKRPVHVPSPHVSIPWLWASLQGRGQTLASAPLLSASRLDQEGGDSEEATCA